MRKTSLDEIPQLINVLKGDMSLIGPRPLLPQYLSLYNADEYWILTVFVKPEHHGKGIGNLLIKTIESYAIKSNIKKLVVPSSITAHKFYYKLGYKYKHNIEKTNDENMYIMEKYL